MSGFLPTPYRADLLFVRIYFHLLSGWSKYLQNDRMQSPSKRVAPTSLSIPLKNHCFLYAFRTLDTPNSVYLRKERHVHESPLRAGMTIPPVSVSGQSKAIRQNLAGLPDCQIGRNNLAPIWPQSSRAQSVSYYSTQLLLLLHVYVTRGCSTHRVLDGTPRGDPARHKTPRAKQPHPNP